MKPLPRIVIVLGLVSFLTDVSSEMILPLLPSLLLGSMGAGAAMVGVVEGIADALSAVLKLVSGRLSDRARSRRPLVVLGYGISTVVRPAVFLAVTPWHVVAVRAVDRVGKGLRSAPRDALIGDAVSRDDAPRAYAFHRMMDHAGAIAGPLVAAALLAWGLSTEMAIAAAWIPGALAVVVLVAFVRDTPRSAPLATQDTRQQPMPKHLRHLLWIVGVFACGVLGDSFLLVRARELGVDARLLPVLWSVLHGAKVMAAARVARTNAASIRMLVAAWLVVAAGIAVLLVDRPGVAWLAAGVLGVGHGAREPLERALVRQHAPQMALGRAFGSYHLVTGLGALPAGVLLGVVWQEVSGRAALGLSAAMGVSAAWALAHVARKLPVQSGADSAT